MSALSVTPVFPKLRQETSMMLSSTYGGTFLTCETVARHGSRKRPAWRAPSPARRFTRACFPRDGGRRCNRVHSCVFVCVATDQLSASCAARLGQSTASVLAVAASTFPRNAERSQTPVLSSRESSPSDSARLRVPRVTCRSFHTSRTASCGRECPVGSPVVRRAGASVKKIARARTARRKY